MVKRVEALCDGKIIGIETIYKLVLGQQINIPDKVEELRMLSRNGKLFCPCGCGGNLILVAGDRNKMARHFRWKAGTGSKECRAVIEGKRSIDAKIVLKFWLDDKLNANDIDSRVPICAVSDSSRKHEFTYLVRSKNVAINYVHDRVNLSDEKFQILEDNSHGIALISIADCINAGTKGQYPEAMMKMQKSQGYCLLLSFVDTDYFKADMRTVFYAQDIYGFWKEVEITSGKLSEYTFDEEHDLRYLGQKLSVLADEAIKEYGIKLNQLKAQVEAQTEAEKELQKKQEKEAEEARIARLAELKRLAEKKAMEEAEALARKKAEKENYMRAFLEEFPDKVNQPLPINDKYGNRWIMCKYCGRVAKDGEFVSFGGTGSVNTGICKKDECRRKIAQQDKEPIPEKKALAKSKYGKCPLCRDGVLREKWSKRGGFIGCSNYPACRFTDSIR